MKNDNIEDLLKSINISCISRTKINWINLFFNKMYQEVRKLYTNLDLHDEDIFKPFETAAEKEFILHNDEKDFYNKIRKKF